MKPRVLIFIDWFSPGYKAGGPTTSNVNIIDHLSDKFDFWVITSDTDYHASIPYPDVKSDCWIDRSNCHVWYFSYANLSLANLCKAAKAAMSDVWYINGIYSRFFSIYPLIAAKRLKPSKTIVSARGMLSPHSFAIKGLQKKLFLNLAYLTGLYKNVIFHGTNEEECIHVKDVISKTTVCYAIENLPRKIKNDYAKPLKEDGKIRLVSFARISPEKNTLYAIKILKDCKSNVTYDIYGQINSEDYWEECKNVINRLPENVIVSYKGSVDPSKLPELYNAYDALYLPTNGENFGHAILECFMNSRPVIISDRTPWRELNLKNIGLDISLNHPDLFAQAIDNLSELGQDLFESMCIDSFRFAQSICNNQHVRSKYIRLFSK